MVIIASWGVQDGGTSAHPNEGASQTPPSGGVELMLIPTTVKR